MPNKSFKRATRILNLFLLFFFIEGQNKNAKFCYFYETLSVFAFCEYREGYISNPCSETIAFKTGLYPEQT